MSQQQPIEPQDQSLNPHESGSELFVVGIGASAGGLSALEELFSNLSTASGAAFVVIQHLSPDFKSLMKDLLERQTSMPIYRVSDGMELQPNSVYLIPPGQNLTLAKNVLHLQERQKDKNQKHELNLTIDLFFNSLAKNFGAKAIGVILSGSGSDGSSGLKAISEAKGIALVQDPDTAEFDGMPKSAIATGVVNQVLPPRELAQLIYQCVCAPFCALDTASNINLINHANLNLIFKLLLDETGIDFTQYKSATMSRRIDRRCSIHNFQSIDDYLSLLRDSSQERQILCSDLLINVTHFFRNYPAWQKLKNQILPELIEQSKVEGQLRFWVTACSTGEEAYSLAILVDEALQNIDQNIRVKIFATDIDREALERASQGIYPASIFKDIDTEHLHKYFTVKDDCYKIKRKIREMLVFSPHDLTKDAGFTRVNLVTCRNVLIYLKPDVQYQMLRSLHFSLVPKGILFLGESENLNELESEFAPLDKKWKFFQKRRDVKLSLPLRASPKISQSSTLPLAQFQPQVRLKPILEQCLGRLADESNSIVLLVGQDNHLLHVSGNSSKIFKAPDGKVTTEVTNMVVLPLQLPLAIALLQAKQQQKSVSYQSIRLEYQGEMLNLNLKVIPPQPNRQQGNFLLVKIELELANIPVQLPLVEDLELASQSEAAGRIRELENELQQTKENLQALVEELETTNEEQQASNEELSAANEELQSTNEELQSTNEELHTVNFEYQSKISELTQLNNDVDNLLKSTEIGVIFLDSQLRIRKFTPAATQIISLRTIDVERPLIELMLKIDCPQLPNLLNFVIAENRPVELEVKHKWRDSFFLMQIHPYLTEDGLNDGLVISFVGIDEIKGVQLELEKSLQTKNRQLAAIETATNGIAILNQDCFIYLNQAHVEMFGYSQPEELLGQSWQILYEAKDLPKFKQEIFPVLLDQGKWHGVVKAKHRDGHLFDEELTLTISPTGDLICVCQDISDRQAMERSLIESEKKYRYLYENTPVMLHSIDAQDRIISVSKYWLEKMGYSSQEVIGKKSTEFITPQSQQYATEVILPEFFRTGNCHNVLYQWVRKDGTIIDGLLSAIAEMENGEIVRSLAVVVDIGEQRQKEKLEEANRAKDNFIAHMSHELRTPLNSIIGFSHLLKQDSQLIPEDFKSIEIIHQSGQHLLTLINDILDLSKLTANRLELKYSQLNLFDFLHEITTIFQIRTQEKGLNFVTHIAVDLPCVVNIDDTRLRQVLLNLLSNAFKFTSTGAVTFSVSCLTRNHNSKLKTVRFEVEDTGRGIPQNQHDSIFAPFKQVEQNSQDLEGTGLGLTICQNIIQLMGSQICLDSQVGQGSRFWFDLDLIELSDSDSCTPVFLQPKAKTKYILSTPSTALVVDDNQDNRLLLVQYLESLGFTVTEADDGQQGLAIAKNLQPDVILVDLLMPVMNGKEMIEQLRQDPQLKDTVVLMVSANIQSIRDSSDIDCSGFLAKPIDLEQLLSLLKQHLQLDWQILESEPNINHVTEFITPAQAELIELLELVDFGNMEALLEQIDLLESTDSKYIPLVAQIRQLAQNCQQEKLEKLLTALIEQ